MKLTKKSGGNFTPHEEGTFRAVCVDVTPLVKQQSKFGDREVFRLVFETDAEPREDGSRQCVWSRGFTPSLNEKANFRKFLRQWFGRDLTAAEEAEFDTEALIGRAAQVVIMHEHGDNGETYANLVACTPHLPKQGEPLAPSGKFTRKRDRQEKGEESSYRGAAKPSEPVRERAYASVVLGAKKAGQDPKTFMENWGESWSRTLNMVRTGALTAQEMATESEARQLEDKASPPDYYIVGPEKPLYRKGSLENTPFQRSVLDC